MDGLFFAAPAAPRPIIYEENDLLMYHLTHGQEFAFKGRIYAVVNGDGNKLSVADQTKYEKVEMFYGEESEKSIVNLSDKFNDFSFSSRETRLSKQLIATDKKHFRIDVDKTLLYRGVLPAGKDPGTFEEITRHHTGYGKTKVFINLEMVQFLNEQKNAGAKVSITSTGGWANDTLPEANAAWKAEKAKSSSEQSAEQAELLSLYLARKGLLLNEFDNKESINAKSGTTFGGGQKFKVLKDTDARGRWNIMIDDQWHQRTGFTYSIDAAKFGMG